MGCGSKGTGGEKLLTVKGKLLKGGLPLKPSANEKLPPGDAGIRVFFYRVGGAEAGEEYHANVNPEDSTFDLGVPPGRYRIAVIMAPIGSEESGDRFKGKYNMQNSKIEREITGKEDLVIDLDKPNG
jgi:hypothetical protein